MSENAVQAKNAMINITKKRFHRTESQFISLLESIVEQLLNTVRVVRKIWLLMKRSIKSMCIKRSKKNRKCVRLLYPQANQLIPVYSIFHLNVNEVAARCVPHLLSIDQKTITSSPFRALLKACLKLYFYVDIWRLMKHGSTISEYNQNNKYKKSVEAYHNDPRDNNQLERFWNAHRAILKKEKPL